MVVSPCQVRTTLTNLHLRRSYPLVSFPGRENDCNGERGGQGGRTLRIITCTDGWVCIVLAHCAPLLLTSCRRRYRRRDTPPALAPPLDETQLHGGSFPVGPDGVIDRTTRRPYLEQQLIPGVELLRSVLYSMRTVDEFAMAVQAAYDTRVSPLNRMPNVVRAH